MPQTSTSAFLQDLKELPAQNLVTARLLAMLDDEDTSARDLGRVIESDPALSAQVMRLANSPFNGLMKQVESASRAVMVLGFTTVRTLAVSAVCNLTGKGRTAPPGFWMHSVTVAAASSVVASHVRTDQSQAFSAGLLHDVGAALLFRHDPAAYERVLFLAPDERNRVAVELDHFELTHPEVGAAVLEASHFPPGFVRAVMEHHLPFEALETALGRIVAAGEGIAGVVTGEGDLLEAAQLLELVGVRAQIEDVVIETEASVEQLSGFLAEG